MVCIHPVWWHAPDDGRMRSFVFDFNQFVSCGLAVKHQTPMYQFSAELKREKIALHESESFYFVIVLFQSAVDWQTYPMYQFSAELRGTRWTKCKWKLYHKHRFPCWLLWRISVLDTVLRTKVLVQWFNKLRYCSLFLQYKINKQTSCFRLRRWYITIPSSDQWCTTIENHRVYIQL